MPFGDKRKQSIRVEPKEKHGVFPVIRKGLMIFFWAALVLFFLIHKDEITAENIVNFTPENKALTAVVMLCLFGVKSVTFFIYGGILYGANGILFPLSTAIMMNVIGTAVMTSIPFFIGRKAGGKTVAKLTERYPKIELLQQMQNRNEFLVAFFVRIVGLLPSDLVSIYLGACGMSYVPYLCGTLIGLFPAMISFSVMGRSINDISSPAFILSAAAEVLLTVLSVTVSLILQRRKKKKPASADPNYTE